MTTPFSTFTDRELSVQMVQTLVQMRGILKSIEDHQAGQAEIVGLLVQILAVLSEDVDA